MPSLVSVRLAHVYHDQTKPSENGASPNGPSLRCRGGLPSDAGSGDPHVHTILAKPPTTRRDGSENRPTGGIESQKKMHEPGRFMHDSIKLSQRGNGDAAG